MYLPPRSGATPQQLALAIHGLSTQVLDTSIDWTEVTGKPATFPPDAHTHPQSEVTGLVADLALKAPLVTPTFTGTPAAPTASLGTNSTQLATTAFVHASVTAGGGTGDVVGPVTATDNAIARWDGTSGDFLEDSLVTISDTGDVTLIGALTLSSDPTSALQAATKQYVDASVASPYVLQYYTNTVPVNIDAWRFEVAGHSSTSWQQSLALNFIGAGTGGFLGGTFSFGAENITGYPCFVGYTQTSLATTFMEEGFSSCYAVYGVGENDNTSLPYSVAAGGAYLEGRVTNTDFGVGVEISVQNTNGDAPRTQTPHGIFGIDSGPLAIGIWLHPTGSKEPYGAYDVSSAIAINGADPAKFRRGIVISSTSIAAVSGHKEAIALARDNQIVWYSDGDASVVRLYGDNSGSLNVTGNVTLTGDLTLADDPSSALHAATKQYVDASLLRGDTELQSLRQRLSVLEGKIQA